MTQKAKGVDYLHSLSHTKWNCRYHIVFAPKFRRKVFYEGRRLEIGKIISDLCKWKGVNLVEGEACPDHIHILVEIPPKMSVSGFMGFVKGKSSQMIYEKWGEPKSQVPFKGVLVPWLLCRHGRQELQEDRRVHQESAGRRQDLRTAGT